MKKNVSAKVLMILIDINYIFIKPYFNHLILSLQISLI